MSGVKRSSTCTVCRHPNVKRIERAIVMKAQTYAEIADSYGLSRYAVERHKTNHMTAEHRRQIYSDARSEQAVIDQAAADNVVKADRLDVMGSLTRLSARCEAILDRAEKNEEDGLALAAIRELRHQVTLAAKILGDLDNTKQETIIIADHPAWLAIRDVLFRVLDRHPDAKADFAATVRSMGNGQRRLAG